MATNKAVRKVTTPATPKILVMAPISFPIGNLIAGYMSKAECIHQFLEPTDHQELQDNSQEVRRQAQQYQPTAIVEAVHEPPQG
jgi:hypothetical protein